MDDKKTLMFHGGQANFGGGTGTPPSISPLMQPPPQQPPMQKQPPMHAPPMQGQSSPMGPTSSPQPPSQPLPWPPQQQSPYPPGHAQAPAQPAPQAWPPQPHNQAQGPAQGHGYGGNHAKWMNAAGGINKKKIILAIVGGIALAVASAFGIVVKGKGGDKNTISYSRLGINAKSANVDELIGKLEGFALKWKKDAAWLGISIYGVKPDGTIDLTADNGGGATIEFASTGGVQSAAKSVRKDSIKEYTMTRKGARSNRMIGATKPWKDFEPVGIPDCKVTNLAAALRERGFSSGTVRVGFDIKFAFASGWAWRVEGKDAAVNGYYSMSDCSFVKAL